jgi:hypothetical protein
VGCLPSWPCGFDFRCAASSTRSRAVRSLARKRSSISGVPYRRALSCLDLVPTHTWAAKLCSGNGVPTAVFVGSPRTVVIGTDLVSRKLVDFRLNPADFGKDCVGFGGPMEGFTVSIPVCDSRSGSAAVVEAVARTLRARWVRLNELDTLAGLLWPTERGRTRGRCGTEFLFLL